MPAGIRATVDFSPPAGCPIARFARETGTVVDQVSTSVGLPSHGPSRTEFLSSADDPPAEGPFDPIFAYGDATLYRIVHDDEVACPCECLGRFGCPVHRYIADGGDLTLVFHAESFEQLQDVMGELGERFESVDVQRLLQPPLEGPSEERVFVNRGRLTDRQREVLRAAYEMGYFERPKRANATEIAAELDITQSTFTEHLVTAQRKILEDVLEGST